MNCRRDSERCCSREERPARDLVLIIGESCFRHSGLPSSFVRQTGWFPHAIDPLRPKPILIVWRK
jgi:hypothetical protein